MTNFNDLAAGVVEQAVYDWLYYRQKLYFAECGKYSSRFESKNRATDYYERKLSILKGFFYSDWCHTLVPGLDPDVIMEQLEKRFEEWKNKKCEQV